MTCACCRLIADLRGSPLLQMSYPRRPPTPRPRAPSTVPPGPGPGRLAPGMCPPPISVTLPVGVHSLLPGTRGLWGPPSLAYCLRVTPWGAEAGDWRSLETEWLRAAESPAPAGT